MRFRSIALIIGALLLAAYLTPIAADLRAAIDAQSGLVRDLLMAGVGATVALCGVCIRTLSRRRAMARGRR
jgi:hypothetical protein